MAAPTVLIADIAGATSGAISVEEGHSAHFCVGDRLYTNWRTTGYVWNKSAQRSAKVSYRNSSWTWTASGANANAFYLRYGSSNPNLASDPDRKWYANGVELTLGASVAALAEGEYFLGDSDTLGYTTIYVRVTGSVDPDTLAEGYVAADTFVWYLTATGGTDPSIGTKTNRMVKYNDMYMPEMAITALDERTWAIGDQDSLGFNTLYVAQRQQNSFDPHTWRADFNAHPDGYVGESYDNPAFAWGAGGPITAVKRWDWYATSDDSLLFSHYGFNTAYRPADGVDCYVVLTITNEDGLSSSAQRSVTATASTRTVRHVSATGNDTTGDGSEGNPWETVAKAVTVLGIATSNVEIKLGDGLDFTDPGGRIITGDNWVVRGNGELVTRLRCSSGALFYFQAARFALLDIDVGGSNTSSPCGIVYNSVASTTSQITVENVIFGGELFSGIAGDRGVVGINRRNTRTTAAFRGYEVYAGNGTDATGGIRVGRHFVFDYGNTNLFGNRDEAARRWNGDYVTCAGNHTRQSGMTASPAYYTKSPGPRNTGGTHHSYNNNIFEVAQDTSIGGLNAEQGTAGVTWAPANGVSTSSANVEIVDNVFIGCGIQCADAPTGHIGFVNDVMVARNVFDFSQYLKQVVFAVNLNTAMRSTCARWHIVHNTITTINVSTIRIFDLQESPYAISAFRIDNNVVVAPNAAITANANTTALMITARTSDDGATEFASITDNCWPVANTAAASGNYAGTGDNTVLFRWANAAGTNTTFWDRTELNAAAYADGNTYEAVTLDDNLRILGTPAAATQASVRSLGVFTDMHGDEFPATNGPVGAMATTAQTQTFTSSGSWVCPAGVTFVTAVVRGGGGAGGSRAGGPSVSPAAGGGGGELASDTVAVTPGETYTVTVGAGGTVVVGDSDGNAGGTSSFVGDSASVIANGGGGGVGSGSTPRAGGAGGTGGTGATKFNGGAGAPTSSLNAGGGGEGASSNANGVTATGIPGAASSGDGGNGGSGCVVAGFSGVAGTAPGGGGGGAKSAISSASSGGSGGRGEVTLLWDVPVADLELLELRNPAGIPYSPIALDGATVDFGTFTVGDVVSRSPRIYNPGDVSLTLSTGGQSIDGDAIFDDSVLPPSTVEVVSGSFTSTRPIIFDTATAGSKSFAFSIAHDGTDTPFNFTGTFTVEEEEEPEPGSGGNPITIKTILKMLGF